VSPCTLPSCPDKYDLKGPSWLSCFCLVHTVACMKRTLQEHRAAKVVQSPSFVRICLKCTLSGRVQ
jgi:hypothetical protein